LISKLVRRHIECMHGVGVGVVSWGSLYPYKRIVILNLLRNIQPQLLIMVYYFNNEHKRIAPYAFHQLPAFSI
jgi:hypothetical protein